MTNTEKTVDLFPTRYFQLANGTVVPRGPIDVFLSAFSGSVARGTEVRVVPLDAEVVTADRLPKVEWKPVMKRWETVPDGRGIWAEPDADPAEYEARAEEYLAMARHLRSNPTPPDDVDEAQVEALADLIDDLGPGNERTTLARRLVQHGVRVGGDPS